jgi:hypothetical protein
MRVNVLLDLDDEMLLQLLIDDQGIMDAGQIAGRKLRVDDDASHAHNGSGSLHAPAPRCYSR